MKAMLLAAGRGERLRPLTDHCPKPLIKVAGKPLIVHALERLAAAGVSDVVINLNWLGEQIQHSLGSTGPRQMRLHYAWEREQRLETGGGIFQVLHHFGDQPFLVLNADVYSEFSLESLAQKIQHWPERQLAHLVLVNNPEHNPAGDFAVDERGLAQNDNSERLTFSGMSILHPALFAGCQPGRFPLAPLLRRAIDAEQVSAELYGGLWTDVGTCQRLQDLEAQLAVAGV